MKKIIIMGLIFLFFLGFLTAINPVNALVEGYTENFDDALDGAQISSDWLTTTEITSDAEVDDQQYHTDNNAYLFDHDAFTAATFVISTSIDETSFQFWFRPTSESVSGNGRKFMITLRNEGVETIEVFSIECGGDNPSNTRWGITTDNGATGSWDSNLWYLLIVSFVSDNLVNISLYDSDEDFIHGEQSTTLKSLANFTSLAFLWTVNADNDFYIDDFELNAGEAEYDQGDISDYESECQGQDNMFYHYHKGRYLEDVLGYKIDTTIRAVDLFVSEYHLQSPLSTGLSPEKCLNNYDLKINGNVVGHPDYWIANGNNWILRWTDCDIRIEDEFPLFEFKHLFQDSEGNYWHAGLGDTSWNPNGIHKWHNDGGKYNGNFDGVIIPNDLSFCFYWDTGFPDNPGYNDSITVEHDSYTMWEDNQVVMNVQVNIAPGVTPTYVQIWNNVSGRITEQNYGGSGFYVDNWEKQLTFIPKEAGTYTAVLVRSGSNLTNDTFTVTDSDYLPNAYIWTEPFVTDVSESFNVNWIYDYSEFSFNVYVLYADNQKGENYKIIQGEISANGSTTTSISENGFFWFWLAKREGVNYFPVSNTWRHYNGKSYTTSSITVTYQHLDIGIEEGDYGRQYFQVLHPYVGQEVVVYLNDIPLFSVGSSSSISFDWFIYEPKLYNVTLELIVDGERTVLDSTYFYAIRTEEIPGILPSLSPAIGAILGTIITITFVLLPIFLQGGFKKKFDTPPLVYALCGGLGIVFSVYLGFFDIWVIFFFIIIGIVISVIMYFKGGGG